MLRLCEVVPGTRVLWTLRDGTLELDDRRGFLMRVEQRGSQSEIDEKAARAGSTRAPEGVRASANRRCRMNSDPRPRWRSASLCVASRGAGCWSEPGTLS